MSIIGFLPNQRNKEGKHEKNMTKKETTSWNSQETLRNQIQPYANLQLRVNNNGIASRSKLAPTVNET